MISRRQKGEFKSVFKQKAFFLPKTFEILPLPTYRSVSLGILCLVKIGTFGKFKIKNSR